tara:strand:- start:2323 stop:3561 length:1239 start_codon:yes stop_codon:yes gene_type:complete
MEFKKQSSKIIKSLLPSLKEVPAYTSLKDDDRFNKSLDGMLLLLYREIKNSEKHFKKASIPEPVLQTELITPNLTGGMYYPDTIKDYVKANTKYQLIYRLNINGKENRIIFSLFTEKDIENIDKYNKYIGFIYNWLFICHKISPVSVCSTLDIFLNLTPYTKKLPPSRGSILGPLHANSAYTQRCKNSNEVIIYREEEWKKVFIHELFHSFCFDPNDNQVEEILPYVKELFPIKSTFLLGESYVETWARILNSAYESYYSLQNKNDTEHFLLNMRFSLQLERMMSIKQMCKILDYMGLTYYDITNIGTKPSELMTSLYLEKTNIFVYYVMVAILMNNYYYFLLWCAKNNSNIFKFTHTKKTTESFKNFIKSQYNDPNLQKTIDHMCKYIKKLSKSDNKYLKYTARMTAVEII